MICVMKDLDCETVPPPGLIYIEHHAVDDAAVSTQENLKAWAGLISWPEPREGNEMVLVSIAAHCESSTAEGSPLRSPVRRALTLTLKKK